MDEQREWLKKRRKRRLRVLGVMLCFCVLAANFPNILETLSVCAALSGDVWDQTALLGTAQAELAVPDTLAEAVIEYADEENDGMNGDGTGDSGEESGTAVEDGTESSGGEDDGTKPPAIGDGGTGEDAGGKNEMEPPAEGEDGKGEDIESGNETEPPVTDGSGDNENEAAFPSVEDDIGGESETETPAAEEGGEVAGVAETAVTGAESDEGSKAKASAVEGSKAETTQVTSKVIEEYKITYHLQGGSLPAGKANRKVYTKNTKKFTLIEPVCTGYTFTGWSNDQIKEPEKNVTVDPEKITGNLEYTANWEPNTYTVTFQYNGATSGNDEKTKEVIYGNDYGELPDPKKVIGEETYYFKEWHTDPECKIPVQDGDTKVTTAKNHPLYARWINEAGTYNVKLKEDKGYKLKAQSKNPVEAGDSYTFEFKLKDGYYKKDSFAVMVNNKKVSLTSKGTYTINDIFQDKEVTVKGVAKEEPVEEGYEEGQENQPEDSSYVNNALPSAASQPEAVSPAVKQPDGPVLAENSAEQANGNAAAGGTASKGKSSTKKKTVESADSGQKDSTESTDEELSATEPDVEAEPEPDGGSKAGKAADDEVMQSLPAAIADGRVVLQGDPVPAGNVAGMLGGKVDSKCAGTTLYLGNGSVAVKVKNEGSGCKAGIADTVAVVNAVLTPEQIKLASNGEDIEIRIDVKDISGEVTEQDRNIIANGLAAFEEGLPGLTVGTYTDISVYTKIVSGEWTAVTETMDKIEMVVGIPQNLQNENREYYIIRVHEGGYTLLSDKDQTANTITINTNQFSSYAIVYRELGGMTDNSPACGLCHICPTFLGSCCFLWMALCIAFFGILALLFYKRDRTRLETN